MSFKQLGFGLALASSLAGAPAQGAPADQPVFGEHDTLAAWLLPYTPVLFDLAVQAGRSFAEITYEARGFDPVTQSFSVSGLRIRRDDLDLAIGRARVGAQQTLIEDIALGTEGIGLPPQLRKAADRLEDGILRGDLLFRFRFNRARSAVDMTVTADFPQAGLIEVGAVLDGFHVLVPLDELGGGEMTEAPTVAGTLHRASITFRDEGLIDLAAAVAAEEVGVSGDQIVDGVAVLPVLTVTELLNGLPGGASEALRTEALGWARLVEAALRERGAVRVSFDPAEPVPLALFGTGTLDEALLQTLNPSFSREPDAAAAAQPAGPVEAALALVIGRGVPQNPERGLDELVRLARGGDAAAYRALAQAFGQSAAAITARPGPEALLEGLLVARALGHNVSDEVLAALAVDLTAPEISALEGRAAERLGGLPGATNAGARLQPDALASLGPRELRRLAYDLFQGRDGLVRDRTRAYVLADVAAALGDPFATSLRDDLAPVVDLPVARRQAEELFGRIRARRSAAPAAAPLAPPPSGD